MNASTAACSLRVRSDGAKSIGSRAYSTAAVVSEELRRSGLRLRQKARRPAGRSIGGPGMDLSFTGEENAFRKEVREFVAAKLPADIRDRILEGKKQRHEDYKR